MMSTRLSELLKPDCIELDLQGKKKPEIIGELLEVISRCADIGDRDAMYDSLMEREELSSTGIGNGIAIPHCLTPKAGATSVAFGRKLEGARFDSVDNQPVTLFFLLIGPEGNPNLHLQLLSKLARYLHDGTFCQKLLSAESSEEVIEAFRSKEEL
jgi:fructose-specific phosphotransferase system IIA component